jgi:hypothetical protein
MFARRTAMHLRPMRQSLPCQTQPLSGSVSDADILKSELTEVQPHPRGEGKGSENASLFFVGTATTILEWNGIRIMTDPKYVS